MESISAFFSLYVVKKYIELARKLFKGSITQEEVDSILRDKSECRYNGSMNCEICSASCYKRILFIYLQFKEGIQVCKDLEKNIENISTRDLRSMLEIHKQIDHLVSEQVNSISGLIKIKQRENYLEAYKIYYLFQNCSIRHHRLMILDEELIKDELKLRDNDN